MNKIKRLASVLYDDFYPFNQLVRRDPTMEVEDQLQVVSSPDELKTDSMLILWGGSDISPSLYGKGRSRFSGADDKPSRRDAIEWACLRRAVELGVPIIGICRGAQMLCAAAGGYLIQHVDNHAGPRHGIVTDTGEKYEVNSLHHQMMYPFDVGHEMLAWSSEIRSPRHIGEEDDIPMEKEPEFVYFPQLKGFAAQWHPEMMHEHAEATRYLLNTINEKIGA